MESSPGRTAGRVVAAGQRGGEGGCGGFGGVVGGRGGVWVVVCGEEELFPAVSLYAELLFGGAYFAGSVGVEVGLLQFLNELFDFVGGLVDEWLFGAESGGDGEGGVDADGPVEGVVAVLDLLQQRDGLVVGGRELSPHANNQKLSNQNSHPTIQIRSSPQNIMTPSHFTATPQLTAGRDELCYGQAKGLPFLGKTASSIILIRAQLPRTMRNLPKAQPKQADINLDTDIEDSLFVVLRKKGKEGPRGKKWKRKGGKQAEKFKQTTYPEKIMRFQLKTVKKTLRVPCYKEEELNLPVRFTRLLNRMEVDNDVDTDEEVVQAEIERCSGWLQQAVRGQV